MYHAGVGYAEINNFLSECNMPVMSKATMHRHEKKIGGCIRTVAETSCKEAQSMEKELSEDKVVFNKCCQNYKS